ncbi:MAG TPA: hypothetical protein VF461_20810, partial [Gemmatimonadaceae bacterium]
MQIRQRGSQVLAGGATALALLLAAPTLRGQSPGSEPGVRARNLTPAVSAGTVVHTRSGDVSGTAAKLPGVNAYLGIPYA